MAQIISVSLETNVICFLFCSYFKKDKTIQTDLQAWLEAASENVTASSQILGLSFWFLCEVTAKYTKKKYFFRYAVVYIYLFFIL